MDAHKTASVARRLRAQRVHGLPLQAGPRSSSKATSARWSRSSPATCSSTPAAQLRPADPARGRVQDRRAAAARRVRDPDPPGQAAGPRGRASAARAKRATRWSTRRSASATAEPAKSHEQRAEALVATRAVVSLDDRRYVLDGPRATIGRSKSVECVLRDPNVSRRHAELRRSESGDWTIVDLGSTNGVKVNGRRVDLHPAQPRRPGDGRDHDLPVRHRAVVISRR